MSLSAIITIVITLASAEIGGAAQPVPMFPGAGTAITIDEGIVLDLDEVGYAVLDTFDGEYSIENVLYFGNFGVRDIENPFTRVTFANITGAEVFGFDDMTVGSLAQAVNGGVGPSPTIKIPEPSSWLLLGTGVVGFVVVRRFGWSYPFR